MDTDKNFKIQTSNFKETSSFKPQSDRAQVRWNLEPGDRLLKCEI